MFIKRSNYRDLEYRLHYLEKEDKERREEKDTEEQLRLAKLPQAPKKFYCSECNNRGFDSKDFKSFKERHYCHHKVVFHLKVICNECLKNMHKDPMGSGGGGGGY